MSGNILHVTDDTFDNEVLASQKAVLVDFWAPWCGPCKAIAPLLDEASVEYAESLTIAKMNVDENQRVPASLNVRGIPTMVIFRNGAVVAQKVGSLTKGQLAAFIAAGLK